MEGDRLHAEIDAAERSGLPRRAVEIGLAREPRTAETRSSDEDRAPKTGISGEN